MTSTPPRPERPEPALVVVQSCHLPHLFFAVRQLRRRFPHRRFEAILLDHPEVRELIDRFPPFEAVYLVDRRCRSWKSDPPRGSADRPLNLVFPLLTRGYRRLKRLAASLPHARLWETDYDGRLEPLDSRRLSRSSWQVSHRATPEFAAFLQRFPHRRLGSRVLLLHSADESLIESSRSTWGPCIPGESEVLALKEFRSPRQWRRLRRFRPDSAVVFLSGEPGYRRLKLLPLLLRIPRILAVNENGHAFYLKPQSFVHLLYHRIRHGVSPPRRRPAVLFIQTEDRRHSDHALRRLRGETLFPESELAVLCPERERRHFESLREVDRVIAYRSSLGDGWRAYREVLRYSPEVVTGIFSGRPVFRKQKLLFWLLADRRRLVFNARLDCYWLTLRTVPRLLRREPLLFPVSAPAPEVLLIQTAGPETTRKAIETLATEKVSGSKAVTVLCSEDLGDYFRQLPQVRQVLPLRPSARTANLRLLRRLWRTNHEVTAALYTGGRGFRLRKLLLLLLPTRNRLVFNANLDCFYIRRRASWKLIRFRPFHLQPEVLLIQTEDSDSIRTAIGTLASQKVSGGKAVTLLCPRDQAGRFTGLDGVAEVRTYRPSDWRGNLRLLRDLWDTDREIVAAVYSGRPIFRLQKLLLFLLPARNRLVFNENLDCYFLRRSRVLSLGKLLNSGVASEGRTPRLRNWAMLAAKALLYLPRFLFLMIWVNWAKLKRAQNLGAESAAGRKHLAP